MPIGMRAMGRELPPKRPLWGALAEYARFSVFPPGRHFAQIEAL